MTGQVPSGAVNRWTPGAETRTCDAQGRRFNAVVEIYVVFLSLRSFMKLPQTCGCLQREIVALLYEEKILVAAAHW